MIGLRIITMCCRHHGSVRAVLLTAAGTSLATQVATAQPSLWGWIVAALPALGLLAVVEIVLSRTADHPDSGPVPTDAAPEPPARSRPPGLDRHDEDRRWPTGPPAVQDGILATEPDRLDEVIAMGHDRRGLTGDPAGPGISADTTNLIALTQQHQARRRPTTRVRSTG
jgi:hypothetical protein